MEKRRVLGISLVVVVLVLIAMVPAAFAQGGGGGGGGQGGGKDQPLKLLSVTPADGAANVSLKPEITMVFNKNVVDLRVREANAQKFSMKDASGNQVAIEVVMADDQIEPEKRDIITVVPKEQLKPGTAYTVVVAPGLESRSSDQTDQEITVTFTTASAAAPAETLPKTSAYPLQGSALLNLALAGTGLAFIFRPAKKKR